MQRAQQPPADTAILARHLGVIRELEQLRERSAEAAAADDELIAAVLDEAARLAHAQLEPLNAEEQSEAPVLAEGRVRLSEGHRAAWSGYVEAGLLGLDMPADVGGQGLPLVLAVAVQELFDRSCPAFGMLPVPIRSAVRLIGAYGDEALQAEWLPQLASGEWGATICISEVEAGSDVARIRTRAEPAGEVWRIEGEKQWISMGDHDAVERIGHCLLARTPGAKGLSLFLVPSSWEGGDNGIRVRRIEEKLGLHLSPTCALGFEGSRAILLGEEGRGLPQMFVMITNMRLAVAAMGLGIAAGALDVAWLYSRERRQGGRGPSPVPIAEHADVQRQLMAMLAPVEMLRGLVYRAAAHAELGRLGGEGSESSAALAEWLLPIIKTLGGEVAFSVASDAMQVLGGAGYTREWPVEQALRDARVLTIFEGTTGIQGLDLLHRRLLRDDGETLRLVCTMAQPAIADCVPELRDEAAAVVELLRSTGKALIGMRERVEDAEAGATSFLALAAEAALTTVAAELSGLHGDDPASERLRIAARVWLQGTVDRATMHSSLALAGSRMIEGFDRIATPEAA